MTAAATAAATAIVAHATTTAAATAASPAPATTALTASDVSNDSGAEENDSDDDPQPPPSPPQPLNRAGMQLEIQGCDSDCDYVCGECEWELCTVNADHGSTCDVRILLDDTICKAVPSRFL